MGYIKVIKKTLCVIFAVLFTVSFAVFFGCNSQDNPPYIGIPQTTEQNITYLEQTKANVEDTVNQFLTAIYKACVSSNVSENSKNIIVKHAKEVAEILLNQNLSQKTVDNLIQSISSKTETYATAFYGVQSGNATSQDVANLKEILGLLSSYMGIDATASVIYHVCDYYYEYLYQKYLEEYKIYGWQYKLDDAEKVLSDKETLTQDITLANFVPTVKLLFFIGEMVLGSSQSNSAIKSLTDAEILLLLKTPDFSDIDMSIEGWKLILSITSKLFVKGSYHAQLYKKVELNGDLDLIADKMEGVIEIICLVQSKFNIKHAEYLVNNQTNLFVKECFNCFTDNDWIAFSNLTDFNFDNAYYNNFAIEYYGSKYTESYNSLEFTDINVLKNSLNTGDFNGTLLNYFAGIFPAGFYGVEL